MLVRVALLFLLFMAVIAWVGRWRLPRLPHRSLHRLASGRARHCPSCGAPLVGKGPCPCQHR